ERLHTATSAGLALALLAVFALAGFGSHALGFLGAIGEQQQLVAVHSIPAETARLFGLHGTPGWWRQLFAAGFLVTLALCLWRTVGSAGRQRLEFARLQVSRHAAIDIRG